MREGPESRELSGMALWLFHATPEEREELERLSAEIRAMPRPEPPPREPDLLKRYRAALEPSPWVTACHDCDDSSAVADASRAKVLCAPNC